MKYKNRKNSWKCLVLAVLILFQMMAGVVPISALAKVDMDSFQIFLIEATSLDFDDRVALTEYLSINLETADDITNETIAGVKLWLPTLSAEVIADSLNIYARRSQDAKFAINALIISGLKNLEGDLSQFPNIYKIFNETIAGNASDMRGFKFFITVMLQARSYTGQPLATDGDPVNKIKFQLNGYESEKERLSGFLGLLVSLKDIIAPYPGSNNFEKLLSFSQDTVNTQSDEEIRAFKIFLGGENYKIYEGDPTQEPKPGPGNGGGGGGGVIIPPAEPKPPVVSEDMKEHIENLIKKTDELIAAPDAQKADKIEELNRELDDCFGLLEGTEEGTSQLLVHMTEALKGINDVVRTVEAEKDLDKINEALIAITNSASQSAVGEDFGQFGLEGRRLMAELKKLLSTAIGKTGTVDHLILSDKSKYEVLDAKMDRMLNLVDKLQQIISKSGMDIMVESTICINLSAQQANEQYVVELPKDILTKVMEKDIKKVELVSDIGRAVVTLDFMDLIEDLHILRSVVLRAMKTLDPGQEINPSFIFEVEVITVMGQGIKVYQFPKPIEIHIPYSLKAGEDHDAMTVFYLLNDGSVKNMGARYDEAEEEFVFNANVLGRFAIKNNTITFDDVKKDHWGRKWIEAMASKGIVSGKDNRNFDPEGHVTRAEFAKMITMTLGLVDEYARSNFSDIAKGAWYESYVASAYNAGIITGRPDGTFAPNENITRQDMAVMLARALQQAAPVHGDKYIDFADKGKIAEYARQPLAIAVRNGLITGKPGNMVDPEGKATRAEAATIIYRLFNHE